MSAGACRDAGQRGKAWLRHLGPVLLGLGLFGLGIWAMHRLLQPLHAGEILEQMRTMPHSVLAIALAATACGYTALIGYDFWALKYLEKKLPLRVVALGGFLGYAFGNTIGISVLSGGAVRYRIYSAFGLNAFEVAALASYIALAMGTGLTLVGVFALALHPAALTGLLPLSEGAVRALALLGGGGTIALLYALAFSGKTLHIRRFQLAMPRPRILTGQMVVALFDSSMAALTLYVLLPPGAPDFITFMAIYATATMVGVLSHVPGGVGVFETVVMAAMPAGVNHGEVAAALLLFRIIYYLLPFAIAFVIVSLNEARLAGGIVARLFGEISEPMRPAFNALGGIVPLLAGAWVFWLGAYLLAVSLMPSVRAAVVDDGDLVGAILLEGGTLFSALAGIALLILSASLVRRVAGAYFLTLIAIAGGVVAALLNDLDLGSAALLIAGGVLLVPFGREFYRQAKITDGVFGPAWIGLVATVALAAGVFFFFVHQATPYRAELWLDFARSANTPRSLRAGLAASAVLLAYTLFIALQPARRRRFESQAEAVARAARAIEGQTDPRACLALSGDKELRFSEDGRSFVMFARRRAVWVALGDPVGPDEEARKRAGWAFVDAAREANFGPVFYQISDRSLPLMTEAGLSVHAVGDEAIVMLREFSLAAPGFEAMRARQTARLAGGLSLSVVHPPHAPELLAELSAVSSAWLADRAGREKAFSVGPFDPGYLDRLPIALVRKAGKIVGFADIFAPHSGTCIAVDMMRYLPEAADGMVEFIYLALIEHYAAAGARELSLGIAPLADLTGRRTELLWRRFGNVMFRHGGAFATFADLRAFRERFRPVWRRRYLAVPVGVSPMSALSDVAVLIAGGPKRLKLRRKPAPGDPR